MSKLPYVEQGDPAGVPVVLLHGVTDSWRSFEGVLPHLPESLHVFALTQRGHGDADRPATGYRARDFAADVVAFMDALGLEPAIVVGHSMGSINALRFAIDHPERRWRWCSWARSPPTVGTPPSWNLGNRDIKLTDPIDPRLAGTSSKARWSSRCRHIFETAVRESLKARRMFGAQCSRLSGRRFCARARQDQGAHAHSLGRAGHLCPRADQEALLAQITGARLAVYEGAGHVLHWEEPERFAADLAAFVTSLAEYPADGR